MSVQAGDEPLLYLAGASEGTTQWRVESLQLLNWGGFDNHHTITFAPTTTLLSGASGTGKSTLLDAYIALMMDSGTAFNGASNDATIGRVRGADQRSLVSYLRGKTDTARDVSGELTDQVLRGGDGDTWGALAVTFVDDHQQRYTVARLFYVPRSAAKDSDLTRKMCTIDGTVNLLDMEPFVPDKFDKRQVEGRFPNLRMHETYGQFSQAFFTRLGIGAQGDGGKALKLLANIQGGQRVSTVDDLYKRLVLEKPVTYGRADEAVESFVGYETTYEEMETDQKKVDILQDIPAWYQAREAALESERLIDTFGVTQTGDTPLVVWELTMTDDLLGVAADNNRAARRTADAEKTGAQEHLNTLEVQFRKVTEDLGKNESHALIRQYDDDINRLTTDLEDAEQARDRFDRQTARLNLALDTEDDFTTAQEVSRAWLSGFDDRERAATEAKNTLLREQFAPLDEKKNLNDERRDLAGGREGRMDPKLNDARKEIARAAGMDPKDLPFVGELLDVPAEHQQWRKAIETTLFGISRVMLVDADHLDHLSRSIDGERISHRVNFQGIDLKPFVDRSTDPRYVSGKLAYKNTPYTAWVQERVTAANTDALCVENAGDLAGDGRRVTINGQTRRGREGAHGDLKAPFVIGFSSKERIDEIDVRLAEIEAELNALTPRLKAAEDAYRALFDDKNAHETVIATLWRSVDATGISNDLANLQAQRQQVLDADDALKELQTLHDRLEQEVKDAGGRLHDANREVKRLSEESDSIGLRRDRTYDRLLAIENAQQVFLTDEQSAYLTSEYAEVATVGELDGILEGVKRLKSRLLNQGAEARSKVADMTRQLEGAFTRYLKDYEDPNLTSSVENYLSFRRILDTLIETGLHERRQDWQRRLTEWSSKHLVLLSGAYSLAISDIRERLDPVNNILQTLPFGAHRYRLRIDLRELQRDDIVKFKKELHTLARANVRELSDEQLEVWFKRLRRFMGLIRKENNRGSKDRDYFLDVTKHIEISAVTYDPETGVDRFTYTSLGGKSGGESQELVAFIVGAALRFQLGDEENVRPRFAPVFLDEGFVKADSEFAGRSVDAWKGLGFQLIIGAPYGQFTALEPHADLILYMNKDQASGKSAVAAIPPTTRKAVTRIRDGEATA